MKKERKKKERKEGKKKWKEGKSETAKEIKYMRKIQYFSYDELFTLH